MEVSVREEQGVHVVSVEGDLTSLTSVAFFNRVVGLRTQAGVRMVLDLHGVAYVDSMGAGQLWRTVESARGEGGDAVLARVPPIVRKILDMVGIAGEVRIFDTVEEAVGSFAK